MERGRSLFVSLLVACGSSAPPPSTPTNHAAPTDCALTGEVVDSYMKEPPKGASVILVGPGLPREVQRTDEAGHFAFAHSAGRTKLLVYFRDRSAERPITGCDKVRIELPEPKNLIDI